MEFSQRICVGVACASGRPVVDITFPLEGIFRLVSTIKKIFCIVGSSIKRLKKAETLLWQGQAEAAQALFTDFLGKQLQTM